MSLKEGLAKAMQDRTQRINDGKITVGSFTKQLQRKFSKEGFGCGGYQECDGLVRGCNVKMYGQTFKIRLEFDVPSNSVVFSLKCHGIDDKKTGVYTSMPEFLQEMFISFVALYGYSE